eukprot:773078-Rhodomonas_salina.1
MAVPDIALERRREIGRATWPGLGFKDRLPDLHRTPVLNLSTMRLSSIWLTRTRPQYHAANSYYISASRPASHTPY